MLFVTIIIALIVVYLIQYRVYRYKAFESITYRVIVEKSEVFEDDEVYIYEELGNHKLLPLPFVKVDTELPDGLAFCITKKNKQNGKFHEAFSQVIHSLFVLRSHEMIKRRWKIRCVHRGTYTLGNATILTNDILGTHMQSRIMTPEAGDRNVLVVLPRAIALEKEFTASSYTNGEISVHHSLISDPLLRAGVREYQSFDPMNRINWLKTAAHQQLMVNVEEYTRRHTFNIIMNMQSKDFEKNIPGTPSNREAVELCLTVAASILDNVSSDMTPVKFICNTPPDQFGEGYSAALTSQDEIGENIFISPAYTGKRDMIIALQMLARMTLIVSTPVEKMLDHIVDNHSVYANGGNIIFISAFLNERMINFCYTMRKLGITVIFYITTTFNNAKIIPEDIEVHFKAYKET